MLLTPNFRSTSFGLSSVGFGLMTFNAATPPVPQTEYFQNLGYEGMSTNALIAPNFQGIGLPEFAWY